MNCFQNSFRNLQMTKRENLHINTLLLSFISEGQYFVYEVNTLIVIEVDAKVRGDPPFLFFLKLSRKHNTALVLPLVTVIEYVLR